jgi:hypothetical protein
MVKNLITLIFYSFITFCVLSYFSVIASLIKSIENTALKPTVNIGFPFKYYYQFWGNNSDSPNCGWNLSYFIYDFIIVFVLVLLIKFLISKFNLKK